MDRLSPAVTIGLKDKQQRNEVEIHMDTWKTIVPPAGSPTS